MSCIISISGDETCLNNFLRVNKRLDAVLHSKSQDQPAWVGIRVSYAGFNRFDEQIREAIRFLKLRKCSALGDLTRDPAITDAYISFAIEKDLEIASFIFLPPELVVLCGKHGLAIRICSFRISKPSRSSRREVHGKKNSRARH